MNQINFYLNNNLVDPPSNWREFGIETNFVDSEFKNQQITINDWEFIDKNIDIINAWIAQGYIFEGIPFRIEEVQEANGNVIILFDGYLDPKTAAFNQKTNYDKIGITLQSKEKYSLDWLNDVAAGFSFDYLAEIGILQPTDYIDVPYVISAIPNYKESAIALVSLTFMGESLIAAGKDLIATLTALITDPLSYGQLFALLIQIIKFTALVIAFILLIRKLFSLLIQRVKYHKAIKVKTLFAKGAQNLGLNFSSTIIPDDWYILPKKYVVPANPQNEFGLGLLGAFAVNEFPQNGYPRDNFATFISNMQILFNGKNLLETSGNYQFERRDYSNVSPQYTLPPIINTEYNYNTDEFISNLLIEFETDVVESNTITNFKGTNFQIIQRPLNVRNAEFVLMDGFRQVSIPYALGKRKTELTTVEKIFDELLEALDLIITPVVNVLNDAISVINDIVDTINEFIDFLETVNDLPLVGDVFNFDFPSLPTIEPIVYTPLGNLIDNRIGMLMLENDYFMKDKLLRLMPDGKLHVDQPSARQVYNDFYKIEIINNQWKRREYNEIPLTSSDYLKLKNNPNAYDENGNLIKMESFIYNPWNKTGTAKTREQVIYTSNLTITELEPNGE